MNNGLLLKKFRLHSIRIKSADTKQFDYTINKLGSRPTDIRAHRSKGVGCKGQVPTNSNLAAKQMGKKGWLSDLSSRNLLYKSDIVLQQWQFCQTIHLI